MVKIPEVQKCSEQELRGSVRRGQENGERNQKWVITDQSVHNYKKVGGGLEPLQSSGQKNPKPAYFVPFLHF